MVSDKTLYWMTVAVLVVGSTNHFSFKSDVATELGDHASAFAQGMLDRGVQYAAYADMALSRHPKCSSMQPVLAETRAQVAKLQGSLASDRAEFQSLQAENAELLALRDMKLTEIQIRRHDVRVNVPNVVVATTF